MRMVRVASCKSLALSDARKDQRADDDLQVIGKSKKGDET